MDFPEIKSGDILFFSNNTPTGIILRTSTSTFYSHTGIAIRILKNGKSWNISKTSDGILCVMEINANPRKCVATGIDKSGFGFSPLDWVLNKQTVVGVRKMKEKYRTKSFCKNSKGFAKLFADAKFPNHFSPFLNVWVGYPLTSTGIHEEAEKLEIFCSEMMAYFYIYVFLPFDFKKYKDNNFATPLTFILGKKCPHLPELIAPKHFEPHNSIDSQCFESKIEIIWRQVDSAGSILIVPAVITLGLCAIIFMSLPGNNWKNLSKIDKKKKR